MPRKLGMNRHQKAAHRVGEPQVSRADVPGLLELAASDDASDRQFAAQCLCPCHVRTRIPAVWEALYRLLEDDDPRVRRAAWHTLEDGGRPDDPAIEGVFERARASEKDPGVLALMRRLDGKRNNDARLRLDAAARPRRRERGKCDFCGRAAVFVERDLDTMIPTGDPPRPALICDDCAAKYPK